jgi:hypothetical protein
MTVRPNFIGVGSAIFSEDCSYRDWAPCYDARHDQGRVFAICFAVGAVSAAELMIWAWALF